MVVQKQIDMIKTLISLILVVVFTPIILAQPYIDESLINKLEMNETHSADTVITLKEGILVQDFLSTLNVSTIDLNVTRIGTSGRWFEARISAVSLEKFKTDSRVLGIHTPQELRILPTDEINPQQEETYIPKIKSIETGGAATLFYLILIILVLIMALILLYIKKSDGKPKMSKKKTGKMFGLSLFFLIISLQVVSAIPYIDRFVIDELKTKETTNVVITLNEGVKLDSVVNSLNLSNTDVKIDRIALSGRWFDGKISNVALKKIEKDTRILGIHPPLEMRTLLEESKEIIGAKIFNANIRYKGKDTVACIIDSGIDKDHSDFSSLFSNKVLEEICYCSLNEGASPGCCPNRATQQSGSGSANDDNGHGTHIAGIIAGDGWITQGVAPKSQLLVAKVCNSSGSCDSGDIANAISWCKNKKATYDVSVISISLGAGSYSDPSVCDTQQTGIEITSAYNSNISVVVASGNDGYTSGIASPACSSKAISVGSVYDENLGREPDNGVWSSANCYDDPALRDKMSCFTNRHNILDILAPGCFIKSTDKDSLVQSSGSCGTSQAAPHVSGSILLLKEAGAYISPYSTEDLLLSTGKMIQDTGNSRNNGPGTNQWFPRIDILNAFQLDWPTENHDFRRTGFTLLKGDMSRASDVERKLNFVLEPQGITSSEQVVKAVVADIDDNGAMETVSLVHQIILGDQTKIYAVENKKETTIDNALYNYKSTLKWSTTISGTTYGATYFPPTIANIDSDKQKELITGVRNGTVYAFDISSDGRTVTERWRYHLQPKWSQGASMNVVRFNGGTAIMDVDLDGSNEIIFADVYEGDAGWPGEVYILKDNGPGNTPTKWGYYQFGNGGAYATVSAANIDADDNPEIIVPSLYGIYVFDYNPAAAGKLGLKWSNSDGKIESSAVIADVDRDNQYEIVYTTSAGGCAGGKTCNNRLYVRTAGSLGELERQINIPNYPRPTPTVANLDNDANLEVTLIGLDAISPDPTYGDVYCYDAVTDCGRRNTSE